MKKELQNIIRHVDNRERIPYEVLIKWMQSEDIEVIGAVYAVFDQLQVLIERMPDRETIINFYVKYFQKCIIENPVNGQFAENRYMASHSLSRFYRAIKGDSDVPRFYLKRIRDMLAKIYKDGDNDVKEAIINGILEHLFEEKESLIDFSDWEKDEDLGHAYKKALEWGERKTDKYHEKH